MKIIISYLSIFSFIFGCNNNNSIILKSYKFESLGFSGYEKYSELEWEKAYAQNVALMGQIESLNYSFENGNINSSIIFFCDDGDLFDAYIEKIENNVIYLKTKIIKLGSKTKPNALKLTICVACKNPNLKYILKFN